MSTPPERRVVSHLSKARDLTHAYLSASLSAQGLEELVPSHGEILMALHLNKTMTMQEVADYLGRSKPTVTVLTDKLIKLGYIKKNRSPEDGRVFQVSLTAKGKRLDSKVTTISTDLHRKIDSILSPQEKQSLNRLLTKLIKHW